jgi:membrane protease YdiL (CAAX protease family)
MSRSRLRSGPTVPRIEAAPSSPTILLWVLPMAGISSVSAVASHGQVPLLTTCPGLVTARYREKTGSLFPAIIIHVLFNIGGMLLLWMVQWLRG